MNERFDRPIVPPGILLHLQGSDGGIRKPGISPESTEAYFEARKMLVAPILWNHRDLRWRYRREMRKELEKSYLAGVEHLRNCEKCSTWFAALGQEFASILASNLRPLSK
jgi:hypothetical protein